MTTEDRIKTLVKTNKSFRKELATRSLYHFFAIYFAHYVKAPFAPFHKELCDMLQNCETPDDLTNVIIGFRGCAKSSIVNLAFPIYRIVTGQSHFVLILADTLPQGKMHIANLRDELETNTLLKADFGPFEPDMEPTDQESGDDTWTKTDMVLRKYKAKIIARSMGQKVRGSLFKQWRPDTIIADDMEDLDSVRTKESRDRTYKWLLGEAFAAGDQGVTKRVVIGNLLHTDGLMRRLQTDIETGKRSGRVMLIPLIREDGRVTWIGRYPTAEALREKRKEVGDLSTWLREYMLKIVPDTGQPVREEWIQYYDEIPTEVHAKVIGVDLAISKKETADFTAFVPAYLAGDPDNPGIYIRPITLDRLTFRETINQARTLMMAHGEDTLFAVENVAYQAAAIEEMRDREAIPVIEVRPGTDKLARLRAVATHIQSGKVKFPRTGCEDLLIQLLHWGVEAHDDAVDSMVYAILAVIRTRSERPFILHV